MDNCNSCKKWLVRQEINYENGDTIVKWEDKTGKGKCTHLKIVVPPEFGCNEYASGGPLIKSRYKIGAPWHYKTRCPCPECKKSHCGFPNCTYEKCPGSENCFGEPAFYGGISCRCAGTGFCHVYDDGYIDDIRTQTHPKEKLFAKPKSEGLKCTKCTSAVDENWNVCPNCGFKLKEGDPLVIVDDKNANIGVL